MKLNKSAKQTDWRKVVEDSIQVDYAQIPTGEVVEQTNEDGQTSKVMVTNERVSFGFQTETGWGRGISWIPVEDLEDSLEVLQHYADNGVEALAASEDWLSPAESIHETITRVPSKDSDGETIEGQFDIAFRVRLGKGSKSCRLPEADFSEFVQTLRETAGAVPDAVTEVKNARAKAEAKAAAAALKASEAGE